MPFGAGVQGADFTNTTYAALSMLYGDGFAKQFGGPSGNDPDWFLLTIYGTTATGALLSSSVTFYLADYRKLSGQPDYIISQWTPLNLSSLAGATCLYFNLTSTDVGLYGLNTPAYFAIDNISYAIDGIWALRRRRLGNLRQVAGRQHPRQQRRRGRLRRQRRFGHLRHEHRRDRRDHHFGRHPHAR